MQPRWPDALRSRESSHAGLTRCGAQNPATLAGLVGWLVGHDKQRMTEASERETMPSSSTGMADSVVRTTASVHTLHSYASHVKRPSSFISSLVRCYSVTLFSHVSTVSDHSHSPKHKTHLPIRLCPAAHIPPYSATQFRSISYTATSHTTPYSRLSHKVGPALVHGAR